MELKQEDKELYEVLSTAIESNESDLLGRLNECYKDLINLQKFSEYMLDKCKNFKLHAQNELYKALIKYLEEIIKMLG
nr:MAG TPA: hypothetical protein [Caudoviricetes sp.]